MALIYKYGQYGPHGQEITHSILSSIVDLDSLITNLNNSGYILISYNGEGVLIDYKELEDFSSNSLDTRICVLEDKGMKKDISKEKEVTEEFFIFLDHLPEHIRKELKIYIKTK